jgi:hypothetical protein
LCGEPATEFDRCHPQQIDVAADAALLQQRIDVFDGDEGFQRL